MLGLALDIWAMMLFCVVAFFGVSLLTLAYTLRQEERKMEILKSEGGLDSYSPAALRDLKAWIEAHPRPSDSEVEAARNAYRECVQTLRSTNRHFYDWSEADIEQLDAS